MAVASLVLGIIALIPVPFLGLIPGVLAIIFGALTLQGLGIPGFILGIVGVVEHIIILILIGK
jgi:hypothetical protein